MIFKKIRNPKKKLDKERAYIWFDKLHIKSREYKP